MMAAPVSVFRPKDVSTQHNMLRVQVVVDGIEKWSPQGHKGADKRDVVFDNQLEFILPGSIANNRQQMVVLEVCLMTGPELHVSTGRGAQTQAQAPAQA